LQIMSNVNLFRGSPLEADSVIGFGAQRVVVATGSHWRLDGAGPSTPQGIPGLEALQVLSPEQAGAGAHARNPVVVFDDDHYYIAHSVAELLRAQGHDVTLVTPLADVSQWSYYTLELRRLEQRLAAAGIRCLTKTQVLRASQRTLHVASGGVEQALPCATFVPVTLRAPERALMDALAARGREWRDAGILSVDLIGDALAPSTVAAAVYAGALYARDLGSAGAAGHFKRERVVL
jgi:dimethylamine/trimethylamine dehydrogenase